LSCFQQAEASTIVTTAHQINAGVVPTMQPITAEELPVRAVPRWAECVGIGSVCHLEN
jgi:hypothetical protein